MRRADREIKETVKIKEIIKNCQVLSLALNGDDGCPYVVPLNFGAQEADGRWILYFHGAGEGTKIDRIREDGRASFCMVAGVSLELGAPACRTTMRYDSVCGSGQVQFVVEKEEKIKALDCIMTQYDPGNAGNFIFQEAAVDKITILKLVVDTITGKSNKER